MKEVIAEMHSRYLPTKHSSTSLPSGNTYCSLRGTIKYFYILQIHFSFINVKLFRAVVTDLLIYPLYICFIIISIILL